VKIVITYDYNTLIQCENCGDVCIIVIQFVTIVMRHDFDTIIRCENADHKCDSDEYFQTI
jgi:hypothetical protein